MKPRLLDLFCCQGGAAVGYARAGFEVVGVDKDPQPRYPFEFHQGDAITWPLKGFDAVHASPPCHDHSSLSNLHDKHGTAWMLEATIKRLTEWGGPWIVENVSGADMPGSLTLCGSEFGLTTVTRDGKERVLKRHRQFVSNVFLMGAGRCSCYRRPVVGVYGHGGGVAGQGYKATVAEGRDVMGMPWATQYGLSQAIPPAYTEFLGAQLLGRAGVVRPRESSPLEMSTE